MNIVKSEIIRLTSRRIQSPTEQNLLGEQLIHKDQPSADDYDDLVRRICHPNLKLTEFKEQDEPFEDTIFKLENNWKLWLKFSLLIKNKLNNNESRKT